MSVKLFQDNDSHKSYFVSMFYKEYVYQSDDGKFLIVPNNKTKIHKKYNIFEYYLSNEYESMLTEQGLEVKYKQQICDLYRIYNFEPSSNFSCFHDFPDKQFVALFNKSKGINFISDNDIEIIYDMLCEIFNNVVLKKFMFKSPKSEKNKIYRRDYGKYISELKRIVKNKDFYFLLSMLYNFPSELIHDSNYINFLYDILKVKSRFVTWVGIRYHTNNILKNQSISDKEKFYRVVDALFYGIVNIDIYKSRGCSYGNFISCIDIFSYLNFTCEPILKSGKYKTFYEYIKEHDVDKYTSFINDKYHLISNSTNIVMNKIIFPNHNENFIVELSTFNNILELFKNYIIKKIFHVSSNNGCISENQDTKTTGEDNNQIKQEFLLTNIFATDNPNTYDFWRGVRLYKHKIPTNRNVLLLVNMHKNIRLRFRYMEEKDKAGNYFILLYDYSNINRYIIDCKDMDGRNIKFMWYDIEQDTVIPLYGTFTPGNIDTVELKYECKCDSKFNNVINGEYDPTLKLFTIYYKDKTFEFLNYLKNISNDTDYTTNINNKASTKSDNNSEVYTLASITMTTGAMNVSNQISTISQKDAIKIHLKAKIKDRKDMLPYDLTAYSYYMYIPKTSEMIEGVIKDSKDGILLEFLYHKKSITSNLCCHFSASEQNLLNAHTGKSICNDTIQLTYKHVMNKFDEKDIVLNISDLPLIIDIASVSLQSRYRNKIKISTTTRNFGINVDNISIDECIRWGYIECNQSRYDNKDVKQLINQGNIQIIEKQHENDIINGLTLTIERDLWSQENLLKSGHSVIIFPFSVSPKLIKDKENITINYINKMNIKHYVILGRQAQSSGDTYVVSVNMHYENDTNNKIINKVELEVLHKYYPDDENTITHWVYAVSDSANNSNISLNIEDDYKNSVVYTACYTLESNTIKVPLEKQKDTLKENEQNNISTNTINLKSDDDKIPVYPLPLYGRVVTIYYQEAWFGKHIHFFPYTRTIESSISKVWYIDQPIMLRFDGETLKIYEYGLELDGYDARSGKVAKRTEIPAKSVNAEDNQTLNTVANKEDNITQAEEKNNLNLIDDEDSIKKVAYPGVSASATLAQDYNGKYYYYDDKNTTKIPEGEYYILVDEPSKSSSTDNAGTQSNEIIVGEPSKFQDKLGERYIEIYKSSELLFNNEDSFNQSINKRKAETKENFGWFGNKTSYLIHGGTDYEDNCGIDLSSAINTFCSDLSDKITNNYNNSNLYTTYGKVPIKLKVKYSRDWHDPLDNPQITVFTQSGYENPANAAFLKIRHYTNNKPRSHHGLDLFATVGTNVYACVDSKVSYIDYKKGYGNVIMLEVSGQSLNILKSKKDINYELPYKSNDGTKEVASLNSFNEQSDVYYLFYAHLSEILIDKDEVKAGDIIAKTGVSGIEKGTCGPHLHFEIKDKNGNRVNPGYYIKYKRLKLNDDENIPKDILLSDEEYEIQKTTSKTRYKAKR